MRAMSSFLILPTKRSSSKNRSSSSSCLERINSSGSRSLVSRRCKYQAAMPSDISSSTSPVSQLPESITTDGMILSCREQSEATSTGPLLKLSECERGKLFSNAPRRQCSKQLSPSAIARHEGESLSSSTPTKAANDPLRAFSSEYHDRLRPF